MHTGWTGGGGVIFIANPHPAYVDLLYRDYRNPIVYPLDNLSFNKWL